MYYLHIWGQIHGNEGFNVTQYLQGEIYTHTHEYN